MARGGGGEGGSTKFGRNDTLLSPIKTRNVDRWNKHMRIFLSTINNSGIYCLERCNGPSERGSSGTCRQIDRQVTVWHILYVLFKSESLFYCRSSVRVCVNGILKGQRERIFNLNAIEERQKGGSEKQYCQQTTWDRKVGNRKWIRFSFNGFIYPPPTTPSPHISCGVGAAFGFCVLGRDRMTNQINLRN